MRELFAARGYEIVEFSETADIYIVNTCTVTNMADRKSRQMLHRAGKLNPRGVVVAVGCYVQATGTALLEDQGIDLIIGNDQKSRIVDIVEAYISEKCGNSAADALEKCVTGAADFPDGRGTDAADFPDGRGTSAAKKKDAHLIDISQSRAYEPLALSTVSGHTRALIKIQDGCDQFCAYCIIPYARGRVRSRAQADIVSEVRCLAAKGFREVVLTGIHISSYGLDFEGERYNQCPENGGHLLELVRAIAAVPEIQRIRLSSLEPRIITEDFARGLADIPKVCAHFHLSLQSGCDETLRRMNRRYTADEYRARCDILRKYFDRPALTTDVIVGFPGETEAEFEATADFLREIGFARLHVFKYSRRSGTRAAAMPDQVSERVKSARSDVLLALGAEMAARYLDLWRDSPMEVLLEEEAVIDGRTYMTGYSREYIRVAVPMPSEAEAGAWSQVASAADARGAEDRVAGERSDTNWPADLRGRQILGTDRATGVYPEGEISGPEGAVMSGKSQCLRSNEVILAVSVGKKRGEFLICKRID